MQVGAETFRAKQIEDAFVEAHRLDRAEAESRGLRAVEQKGHEPTEPQAGLRAEVAAHAHPREHDLLGALAEQAVHLFEDPAGWLAEGAAAGAGDDAEGANVIASLLHLDHGPVARILAKPPDSRAAPRGVGHTQPVADRLDQLAASRRWDDQRSGKG